MKTWLEDWQAKLICLILAIMVWLAVKARQDPDFDGDDEYGAATLLHSPDSDKSHE